MKCGDMYSLINANSAGALPQRRRASEAPFLPTVLLLTITLALGAPEDALAAPDDLAPLITNGEVIEGEYLVVTGNGIGLPRTMDKTTFTISPFRAAISASERAEAVATANNGRVIRHFRIAVVGFLARLDENALDRVRASPGVSWVQANRRIPVAIPGSSSADFTVAPTTFPRGLDRTDQRLINHDGRFEAEQTSRGVHVYVVDTGINTHDDFEDRLRNTISQKADWFNGTGDQYGPTDACRDHGTRVASVIGGKTYGMAKHVILHPVRVIRCDGSSSSAMVVAGLEWSLSHYLRAKQLNGGFPAVINISLVDRDANSDLEAINVAANNAIEAGLTVVAAAGNTDPYGGNACRGAPAQFPPVITVGSTSPNNDRRVLDSDIGKCLDLFAPGSGIASATAAGPTSSGLSGQTSFAAPHVAGVVALLLGRWPAMAPEEVWRVIYCTANVYGATSGWPGIPNRGAESPDVLLHWGQGASSGFLMDPRVPTLQGMKPCSEGITRP
jgi:large repetitive protein